MVLKKKNKKGKWVWFGEFVVWGVTLFSLLLSRYSFFPLFPFPVLFFVGKKDVIRPCDWWYGGGNMHGW